MPKYIVPQDLIDDARKARQWHEARGMKPVTETTGIPLAVAQWILMRCKAPTIPRILVHADGGDCHGTPLNDGRCPKCGIVPDMQSTELWSHEEIGRK